MLSAFGVATPPRVCHRRPPFPSYHTADRGTTTRRNLVVLSPRASNRDGPAAGRDASTEKPVKQEYWAGLKKVPDSQFCAQQLAFLERKRKFFAGEGLVMPDNTICITCSGNGKLRLPVELSAFACTLSLQRRSCTIGGTEPTKHSGKASSQLRRVNVTVVCALRFLSKVPLYVGSALGQALTIVTLKRSWGKQLPTCLAFEGRPRSTHEFWSHAPWP
jgi:hypothetical protein